MGTHDLGPRPPRLFLVELDGVQQRQRFFLAWKERTTLSWIHAGFRRMQRPSVTERTTTDSVAPTRESIGRDFASAFNIQAGDVVGVWDVTERVGYVHPRIYRPELHEGGLETERPTVTTEGRHSQLASSVSAAQLLFDDLDDVLATVEPTQQQFGVFGHRLRSLLLLACMEVDTALKHVADCNGSAVGEPRLHDHARLARPMRLGDWEVRLVRSVEGLTFTPFDSWSPQSPRLPWYTAYNNTKHDREAHLEQARLDHVLDAVAAVYILLVAQFGADVYERLRHRPFETVHRPRWESGECYVLSPFDEPEWQSRGCLIGTPARARRQRTRGATGGNRTSRG